MKTRAVMFRIGAVLFGITLFALVEALCHVAGWGDPTLTEDPFVGFESVVPLFIKSDDGARMEVAEGRKRFFAADSFIASKPANTFRIFCLGGSTVQGRPFSIETSFTTWLEQSLIAADSDRDWEVINCGGVSYASYRLVPILEELLGYEPDLVVVCTGHNEFLEDRTYESIKPNQGALSSARRLLARSRVFSLLHSATQPAADNRDKVLLSTDVQARLDYRGGLDLYERNDDWNAGVVAHFEQNLRRMVSQCDGADVPLLLMRPPSNLADCPPFKSVADGTEADEKIQQAHAKYRTDLGSAIRLLTEAAEADSRRASLLFELGKACESRNQIETARDWFVRARDEDVCPLRITSDLEEAMNRVVLDRNVPFLNLHTVLELESRSSIMGDGLLVDHIHPSFRGHQIIAHAIAEKLAEMEIVSPRTGWSDAAKAAHKKSFSELDDLYFLRGQRTLETLREWSKGRAKNVPKWEDR